jgi:hypothetical protein
MNGDQYLARLHALRGQIKKYEADAQSAELPEMAGIHGDWVSDLDGIDQTVNAWVQSILGAKAGLETDLEKERAARLLLETELEGERGEHQRACDKLAEVEAQAEQMLGFVNELWVTMRWLWDNGHLPPEVASEMPGREGVIEAAAAGDWKDAWQAERGRRQQRVHERLLEVQHLVQTRVADAEVVAAVFKKLGEVRGAVATGVLPDEWPHLDARAAHPAPREGVKSDA